MGEIVVNQHYIPQCVLNHFCNEKQQIFECLVNSKKVYPTNIKNSMVERDTYEHPYFEPNRIEKWFSRIEGYMGPAIKHMITIIDAHIAGNSNFNEIRKLINRYLTTFLIFYYRSGALLFEYSTGREDKHDRILLMTKKLINSNYIRALSKSIIQNYNFAVIYDANGKFLMSDQFISTAALSIKNRFYQISNRHMGLKDTMILIPISKNYYSVYYHGNVPRYINQNQINILNEIQTDEINGVIINNTYHKCISNSKESIEEVLKKYKFQAPSEILAGDSDDKLSYASVLKKEIFFYSRDKKAWELISFFYHDWGKYDGVGRNDNCPCGSGEKFKKCCLEPLVIAKRIIAPFAAKQMYPFASVNMLKDAITIDTVIEQPIDELYR